MTLRKQNVINELTILGLTGALQIFDNQEIIACNVVTAFKSRKIVNVMVLAKTQSGKTGSMCATIKKYLEDTSNLIPIENIYIITGLSSCEWKEQTKARMPESIQKRVLHRGDLPVTFADEIAKKRNVLIIMDEIQVAAKTGQTIYTAFGRAGLLDKATLYGRDVKIIEYTATPDGTIYVLMKWGDSSCKMLAPAGDGYVGSMDLLQMGRVKQYASLGDARTIEFDEHVMVRIRAIKRDVDTFREPMYHIIRTANGKGQSNVKDAFKRVFDTSCVYITYDRESEIADINTTLRTKPMSHTFIFIKEMLRCAKTLHKRYLGVLYERCSNTPDDAAIIQGLVGRNTGYDDNGVSICYTNVGTVERYERLWSSGFEDRSIKWVSKTTRFSKNRLIGVHTFNDPTKYAGFDLSDVSDAESDPTSDIIKKFDRWEDAKEYFNKELKPILAGRGPTRRTMPNSAGFYEATIKKVTKAWSCAEMQDRPYYRTANNGYRLYPCYEDPTDKTTLQWWFIHQ